jgi:Sulfotransferase family
MIINHSHKFVFVHVPKAAGTSVTRTLSALTRYCDQEIGGTPFGESVQPFFNRRFGLRKHSPARDIIRIMGAETWEKYFSFSFVRNPFDRLVSSYYFLKSWSGVPENFLKSFIKIQTLDEFLESDLWTEGSGPDNIFMPQFQWLTHAEGNNLAIDFLGKTETLSKDLATIGSRIGINLGLSDPAHLNKSPKYDKKEYWDKKLIERITKRYAQDFYRFDYKMIPDLHEK